SRRRHTRFSRDWRSDVCSSDLDRDFDLLVGKHLGRRSTFARYGYNDLLLQLFYTACIGGSTLDESQVLKDQMKDHPSLKIASAEIGRASCRERVKIYGGLAAVS